MAWVLFVMALSTVSIIAVLPEIKNQLNVTPAEGEFKAPDITINFSVVDSARVKSLESFNNIQTEFTYLATDQSGMQSQGTVSASSKAEAKKILEGTGLTVISLQEINVGRSDPFVSYYAPVILKNR